MRGRPQTVRGEKKAPRRFAKRDETFLVEWREGSGSTSFGCPVVQYFDGAEVGKKSRWDRGLGSYELQPEKKEPTMTMGGGLEQSGNQRDK